MEEGKGRRTGKRTRRTRQQILEAEAALAQPQPSTSSSFVGGSNDGGSSLNQKKSLRIRFQDAKSGKLGRKSKSKLGSFVWPRTVEATKDPFEDPTGKNKLYYLLSIGVYPVSKIIQPSDTESDEEEGVYEPVDVVNDDSPSREAPMPYFRSRSSGSNGPVYAEVEDNEEESRMLRSPSPASPKVRRGRRPTNSRRVPYGRANDLDHSWRSNYNRRCAQKRIRQQGRQRIRDPQVIQDIINAVIERYSQAYYLMDNVSPFVSDDNNNVVNDEVEVVV